MLHELTNILIRDLEKLSNEIGFFREEENIWKTTGSFRILCLTEQYPEQVLGFSMTTGYFLMHLSAHLSYHLGQINYLRRVLE